MFDTMTMTKILGGLCGSLLIFLLGGWAAEIIYHGSHDGHEQAYVIEVEGDEDVELEVEEGPDFNEVFAMADPAAGQGLWRACQSCHALEDGRNGTGPHLYGVVGRDKAAVSDYNYSAALESMPDAWTPENLNSFIANPRGYAPGTTMSYNGMRSIEDRANLIAYLDTIDD